MRHDRKDALFGPESERQVAPFVAPSAIVPGNWVVTAGHWAVRRSTSARLTGP